eukprot:scaffold18.g2060.t1
MRPLSARLPSRAPFRAIATLAAVGVAETAYLTAAKLAHVDVVCPLSGSCAQILTSDYSDLLGVVPLSALGLAAYSAAALLGMAGWRAAAAAAAARARPAVQAGEGEPAQQQPAGDPPERLAQVYRTALAYLGVSMAACSSYLMWVMLTQFEGELCPWCIGSAALSFSIAGLAISGLRRRELEDAAGPGLGLAATALLALSLTLGTPDGAAAGGRAITELPYRQPEITTVSSERGLALAARLNAAGARMYGAFWCSHCYEQKEAFGREAMATFPYVECFPNGWRKGEPMATACQEAPGGLEGFPTWVIGGKKLVGEQSLEALEAVLNEAAAAAPAPAAASQ